MSTIPTLIGYERSGERLRRFTPRLRGAESEVRKMTVSINVHAWLGEDGDSLIVRHRAAVRAHLGVFVRGEPVDDLDYMKRVEDRRTPSDVFRHGVWSIRPSFLPQHRLFGFFAITDWFVALTFQSRNHLEKSQANWEVEIDKCWSQWKALFPDRMPWIREELREYVSRNVEKRDDRW